MQTHPLKTRKQLCIVQKLSLLQPLSLEYLTASVPWTTTKDGLLTFLEEMQEQKLCGIHLAHNTVTGEKKYTIYYTVEALTWAINLDLV